MTLCQCYHFIVHIIALPFPALYMPMSNYCCTSWQTYDLLSSRQVTLLLSASIDSKKHTLLGQFWPTIYVLAKRWHNVDPTNLAIWVGHCRYCVSALSCFLVLFCFIWFKLIFGAQSTKVSFALFHHCHFILSALYTRWFCYNLEVDGRNGWLRVLTAFEHCDVNAVRSIAWMIGNCETNAEHWWVCLCVYFTILKHSVHHC